MKIHITGGEGYIGRHTVARLRAEHEVVVTDVGSLDVRDLEALTRRFKAEPVDCVIHLGGLMGAQASKQRLYDYLAVNAVGTLNVLEAAHRAGIRDFLFLSSMTVHGASPADGAALTEDSPFAPRHPYATSKMLSEYMIRDFVSCYRMRALILRPTIIVGNLQGEENAVNDFAKTARRGGVIEIYGSGEHRREFVSVRDVVESIACGVAWFGQAPAEGVCETLLITSGTPVSMNALAEQCMNTFGGGELRHVPTRAQAFDLVGSRERSGRVLGWTPKDALSAMIADIGGQLEREERKVNE